MKALFKKIVVYVLTLEAQAVLRRYKPQIVAVTGSVGKTSTKDAIFAVVSQGAHARRSEKSFNSEIGIPLTILGLPNGWDNPFRWIQNMLEGLLLVFVSSPYPRWLVLEVGADRPGDIKNAAKWLKVDIALITRLPEVPVHVEFFDSPTEVVEEKAALITALKPGGMLILYGDDDKTRALSNRVREGTKILRFGLKPDNEVYATNFSLLREGNAPQFPLGISATLHQGGESAPLSVIGTAGEHQLLPAVAAAAVGEALQKDISSTVEALKSYTPPLGRMHLLRGLKNSLVIDDTYNSSPAAVIAGLDTLKSISTGRRIVVLGDMSELGRHSIEEHKKIGAYVAEIADILLTVGFRARGIAEGALENGMSETNIFQYEDSEVAGDELDDMVTEGDVVFIKGSQSMRMEHAVKQVMAEPERADELLVRQDAEWRRR